MMTQIAIPDFFKEAWYFDPSDHRCPHDAWLDSIQIIEPATGERSEIRHTDIVIRLFGAYHDGHITFRHHDIRKYSVGSSSSSRGHGDWIRDDISVIDDGLLCHQIKWCEGTKNETDWLIICSKIDYEWIPNQG